jgi:PTS system ascorbate-specific IIA component
MIAVIEEFGAYVVIAPGLALAHARPGSDVRREGLSLVTLAEPVPFGHPHNDPVRVVVGLAVSNAEDHVASVAKLANAFNDAGIVGRIARATTPAEVRELLGIEAALGSPEASA